MNESQIKTELIVRPMKKLGFYARRIEDQYSVGFPDLILKLPSFSWVFAEAKVVRGSFFNPSPRQLVELVRLDQAGNCWSIVIGYNVERKTWSFSTPKERVVLADSTTFHSINPFPTALREYLTALSERQVQ
jgi:hypothetical protein